MKAQLFIAACLLSVNCIAQERYMLDPKQALLFTNSSFAGENGGLRLQSLSSVNFYNSAAYRYYGVSETTIDTYNSADAYIKKARAGLSLGHFSSGLAGELRRQFYSVSYAQHFSFFSGKLQLIPSVQFGCSVFYKSNSFMWPHYSDYYPSYGGRQSRVIAPDLGGGFLINYKTFYLGVSHTHVSNDVLDRYDFGNFKTMRNWYVSNNFKAGKRFLFNLALMGQLAVDYENLQLSLNSVLFSHLTLGGGINSSNAWFANVGYKHSLFTVQVGYAQLNEGVKYSSWNAYQGVQLSASFNLRGKQDRELLTNFERW